MPRLTRDASTLDAVVIGSGPNGLGAAITLARAGRRVLVLEGAADVGGGMRSRALTLDGFTHDVCSAVHPLALSSPFFKLLPLEDFGLEWVHPPLPLAHPLTDGTAVSLPQSLDAFVKATRDRRSADVWLRMMSLSVRDWDKLMREVLRPALHVPRHPGVLTRFAIDAIRSASGAARAWFADARLRTLFAGCAAHAMVPLDKAGTAAFGLMLAASAHAVGWPFPRGGSQRLADALAAYFRSLGGSIETSRQIEDFSQLPQARAYLFDTSPHAMVRIAAEHLPRRYRDSIRRFRYGMGVFKIDWALREPIPWRAKACREAGTLHIGASLEEIEQSELDAWEGRTSDKPFVLLAQQSLFDDSRAPSGRHTAWGYCHTPGGSATDMTKRIEAQVERFAPGFRDCVLARHTMNAQQMEAHNPNYVGGDVGGGAATLMQTLFRPVIRMNPYTTPNRSIFLCSSSTPPGGGVHGMCGHHAANAALRGVLR